MSAQRFVGVVLIVLALVIGIVPQYFNCQHDGKGLTVAAASAMSGGSGAMTAGATKTVPMKCFWTARAAIAVAVPLGIVGLFLALARRKEGTRALSVLAIASGASPCCCPPA